MRTTREMGCLLPQSAATRGSSDATAADEVLGRAAQAWALAGGDIDALLGRAVQPTPAVDVADGGFATVGRCRLTLSNPP